MRDIKKFLVIGGDKRQIYMAKKLKEQGYDVELYGLGSQKENGELKCNDAMLPQVTENFDAIILPLPVSKDGVQINMPLHDGAETLDALSKCLKRDQVVFAGMMDHGWKSNFFKKGIAVYDYFEREELIVNNAVPTAQGVIKIAIENLPITLHNANCVIVGFGRTAKVLARVLCAMGSHVTIAARKFSDLAWAGTEGIDGVFISDLHSVAGRFDFLVNTVPTLVVDEKILKQLRPDCLIIEIASPPYGIDFDAAKNLELNTVCAGSLPGKVAPKTAGEIISDAIVNIIKEGS